MFRSFYTIDIRVAFEREGRKVKKNKYSKETEINRPLLNVISPIGIEVKRNYISIGESIGKAYGLIKYPQKVDFGWLSKLTNIPGTIASITFKPIDNSAFIESLSRSIIQSRGTYESARDPLIQKRAERAAIDGEKIMIQIDQDGEQFSPVFASTFPVKRFWRR